MCRIKFVYTETYTSKLFKDISEDKHICFQVYVMVVSKVVTTELSVNVYCVLVISKGYISSLPERLFLHDSPYSGKGF